MPPSAPLAAPRRKRPSTKGTGDVRAIGTLVASDTMMVEPARFVAKAWARAGRPVYAFRFSYVAESMRGQWRGAPHATDIPYVFDTVAAKYGSALTPDMVRQRIHAIIAAEDPATPIKDEDIAEILKKDGIPVARRTVAKYRGELGVGSSKERVGHAPMRLAPRPEPAEAAEAEAAEVEEAELVLV